MIRKPSQSQCSAILIGDCPYVIWWYPVRTILRCHTCWTWRFIPKEDSSVQSDLWLPQGSSQWCPVQGGQEGSTQWNGRIHHGQPRGHDGLHISWGRSYGPYIRLIYIHDSTHLWNAIYLVTAFMYRIFFKTNLVWIYLDVKCRGIKEFTVNYCLIQIINPLLLDEKLNCGCKHWKLWIYPLNFYSWWYLKHWPYKHVAIRAQ